MPTLGITHCCVFFGRTLYTNIPTSRGAAQWIKAQIGKLNLTLGSVDELGNVSLCSWKRHLPPIFPKRGKVIYPSSWSSPTKYCVNHQVWCCCGGKRKTYDEVLIMLTTVMYFVKMQNKEKQNLSYLLKNKEVHVL